MIKSVGVYSSNFLSTSQVFFYGSS